MTLDEILGDLGGRPQELFWKEDANGVLYGAADRTSPEVVARIALGADGVTADEVEPEEVDWRSLDMLNEVIQDPQFD